MSFAIDVNILLYASDADSSLNPSAVQFLQRCASEREVFCLAWPTMMGYLRIATHPAIFAKPLSPQEAMENIDSLLARHQACVLAEEEGFLEAIKEVAKDMRPREVTTCPTRILRPCCGAESPRCTPMIATFSKLTS